MAVKLWEERALIIYITLISCFFSTWYVTRLESTIYQVEKTDNKQVNRWKGQEAQLYSLTSVPSQKLLKLEGHNLIKDRKHSS